MKRVRRISISVERHEISASITQTKAKARDFDSGVANDAQPPASCPSCSEPSFLSLEDAVKDGHVDAVLLQSALEDSIYFQRRPGCRIWICQRCWRPLTNKLLK